MNEAIPNDPAGKLRKIALIVLMAGIFISALIYAFGSDESTPDENTLSNQYYKSDEIKSQQIWGGEGSLVLGISRSFRRARTYSALVLIISAIASIVCLYIASHPYDEALDKTNKRNPKPEILKPPGG